MTSDKYKEISNIIDNMIASSIICGASYSFFNSKTVSNFYKGFQGIVSPFNKISIKENMYYDIASLTKVVGTTTRILQLIEEGVLSLNTEVKSILPSFQYNYITIENLLLHNSGLINDIENKNTLTKENIFERIYLSEKKYETGSKTIYSDIGFILLGFIIEKLDNATLEESFKKNIFEKLKMKNTSYKTVGDKSLYIPTEQTEKRELIHKEVHDSKAFLLGEAGSAGIFSTLNDLVIFAKSFLSTETENNKEKILNPKNMLKNININNRTYGWDKKYGNNTLYHTGFTGTSILINFEKKEGFILLTNRIHPNRDNNIFLQKREILNKLFLEN